MVVLGLGLGALMEPPRLPGRGHLPGPCVPAHPVPQVGGWRLPVQLGEGLGDLLQVGMEQLGLCLQLVGDHLPVTAQQRPALHIHELRVHGRDTW